MNKYVIIVRCRFLWFFYRTVLISAEKPYSEVKPDLENFREQFKNIEMKVYVERGDTLYPIENPINLGW